MNRDNEDRPRTELFVRSIPADVTSDQLGEFFSDFAPVKHSVVVMDKDTGESKRFGFVAFATPEDALTAKERGAKVQIQPSRYLQIDTAKPRNRGDDTLKDPVDQSEREKRKPRLLIRNCPWSLRNPRDLEKLFSKYGKVVDAYIPRGPNNRMSGFAFVTMKRKKHAKRAIEESQGLKIHDREVSVSFAVEKSKWVNRGENSNIEDEEEESESESESESDDESAGDSAGLEPASQNGDKSLHELDEIPLEDELNSASDQDLGKDESDEEDEAVDQALDNSGDEASLASPKKSPTFKNNDQTIFVRNVPYDADAASLKEHFEQFGTVAYAIPVMDKAKNQPKGTAFVAFTKVASFEACVQSAPQVSSSSLLVPDDVDPRYVFEGRVLHITRAVQRDTAERLADKRSQERLEVLGKAPKISDKRRLFLINEGRIAPGSRLAGIISKAEMEIREKSYKLRRQQLSKNPSLHLSMTRLAVRNLPRSMDEKAFKALGRKAIVQFATEVRENRRQPLTKEEVMRSVHHQDSLGEPTSGKKSGVVKQAKIIQELKGSGEAGRSRGYGFLELRNHKAALMALRWLNAHAVTKEEIAEGSKEAEPDKVRRLVVEFAVENAQVVKRQRERQYRAKEKGLKRKAEEEAEAAAAAAEENERRKKEAAEKKHGNAFIGRKRKNKKLRKS